jgi:hypothetical protein
LGTELVCEGSRFGGRCRGGEAEGSCRGCHDDLLEGVLAELKPNGFERVSWCGRGHSGPAVPLKGIGPWAGLSGWRFGHRRFNFGEACGPISVKLSIEAGASIVVDLIGKGRELLSQDAAQLERGEWFSHR